MKKKKRVLLGRLCLACSLLVLPMMPVHANEESDLENLKTQQSQVQEEKNETAAQLQNAQARVDEAISAIESLDQQIIEAEATIQELDQAIEKNLEQLEIAKEDLLAAEVEEAYWYQALKQRIQMMYESGNVSYIEVMLKAESMSDLLSKWEYSKALAEKDQEIMAHLTESRERIESQKALIEEEERILEENRAIEQTHREELEVIKEEKNKELYAVQQDADTLRLYQQHLDQVEAEIVAQIAETEKIIAEKEAAAKAAAEKAAAEKAAAEKAAAEKAAAEKAAAEKAAAEKEAAEAAKKEQEQQQQQTPESTPAPEVSSSGFLWPVAGYSYISSPFGNRISPISGAPEFHRGIDIPAPSGTPIRAAAAGTVITACYNPSYGNYVMVSHSDGYVTLYAHAVSLNVTVGQTVNAGDTVAFVGTTGDSTGNHLHFEVRLNGALMDPEAYVSP